MEYSTKRKRPNGSLIGMKETITEYLPGPEIPEGSLDYRLTLPEPAIISSQGVAPFVTQQGQFIEPIVSHQFILPERNKRRISRSN